MAISDIKKANNDNQEELKQTKRKRDWTDEIADEESDSPPERLGKIGHRMREENEKRIKELEEEVGKLFDIDDTSSGHLCMEIRIRI